MRQEWQSIVSYGVAVFSFLILGKEMSGVEFSAEIRRRYHSPKAKIVAEEIEKHLTIIKVRNDGMAVYNAT